MLMFHTNWALTFGMLLIAIVTVFRVTELLGSIVMLPKIFVNNASSRGNASD